MTQMKNMIIYKMMLIKKIIQDQSMKMTLHFMVMTLMSMILIL